MQTANAMQDAIKVEQAKVGAFEAPNWDSVSQGKVREALNALGALRGTNSGVMFGTKEEVDPVAHLIGTAVGWGGNPPCRGDLPWRLSQAQRRRDALHARRQGRSGRWLLVDQRL